MKVKIGGPDAAGLKADLLAISVFEGESEAAGDLKPAVARDLRALITKASFDGKQGSVRSLPAPKSVQAPRVLLLGLGRRGVRNPAEAARRAAGKLHGRMAEHGALNVVLLPPGAELESKAARSGSLEQMTRAFRLNLQALSLLALLVGMFLIYNTMSFAVLQRR